MDRDIHYDTGSKVVSPRFRFAAPPHHVLLACVVGFHSFFSLLPSLPRERPSLVFISHIIPDIIHSGINHANPRPFVFYDTH